MSLVCAQCSRVNPTEASYCYYDGAALAGRAGGPINAGAAPFPNPFVFPSGLSCRNFDQLAMACQQNWAAAIDLLRQGFLGSFFGGIGRVDLAAAAQEAAKFPDLDRGLDQLLAKLPSQAVQEPKLQAEPTEINLGIVKIGDNRATELHLANGGMRLLYGTVTSDSKWLTLGDAPGNPDKLFQFGAESILPVQIRGQHLRAGNKPLEGHLVIDSNGGTITVTVRADVPITPYDGGLFAGATTPRQVAEKAKAGAKEAAPYFETGAVAKWYAQNGWVYPVQGPTMAGPGGIQQFFEALGVAKPPKVEFSPKSLTLDGAVGKTVESAIEVTTAERKVVYGWATCDASWVEIGKTKITGKVAKIPLTFRIPSPCPPSLDATLHVVGNGNQKTDIPLKIKIAGGKSGVQLKKDEEFVALEIIDEEEAPLVITAEDDAPSPVQILNEPAPKSMPPTPSPISAAASAPAPIDDDSPFAVTDSPTLVKSSPGSTSSMDLGKASKRMPLILRILLNLIPVAILGLCLLVLIVLDFLSAAPPVVPRVVVNPDGNNGPGDDDVDKNPTILLKFDEGRIDKDYNDTMNWAVHKINPIKDAPPIRLNYYDNGAGNNTLVKIDTRDWVFGENSGGKWIEDKTTNHKKGGVPAGRYGGKMRTFVMANGIHVTQTVTIEPSEPADAKGEGKRQLATALCRYKIENKDKAAHKVGMRVMMDTFINESDDVPFLIPGVPEPVTDKARLVGKEVPGFVQVLEKASVRDPGTILHMGLRISDKIDPPDEFMLTAYTKRDSAASKRWKIDYADFKDDSCVVLYWEPKEVPPKGSRELGFTYGIGIVSADGDTLGMSVGGEFRVGGELTVVALVSDDKSKSVTLKLPPGMKVIDEKKEPLTQPVGKMVRGRASPISWRVRTDNPGAKQNISISTDSNLRQSRLVTITQKSLFN